MNENSLYNFLNHVYLGSQASPSIRDGAYIQYVMEKARESNRLKQWVDIE